MLLSSKSYFIQYVLIQSRMWLSSDMFTGQEPTDAYLEAMIGEAAGPINFTMFLTMFGEKLNGKNRELLKHHLILF